MASEMENSIKKAAVKIAKYVEDIATLNVDTKYVQVQSGGSIEDNEAHVAARTTIKLDGDNETIVPTTQNQAGELEVNTMLFNIHQENVTAAIEYRANMMDALLNVLRPRQE